MPAIAKILIVFAAMLALSRARVPLGLAIMAGAAVLGFWAGRAPEVALADFGRAWTRAELWLFLLITVMIVEYGRYMTEERNARAIVASVQRWGGRHGRAWSLMAIPSAIGLIPMPAGALFSAPFVEQTAGSERGDSVWKTAVNYWFRHTWEYWWPLYPGIIVAMSVFKMETWRFIGGQILLTPVALLAGYWVLIRPRLRTLELVSQPPAAEGMHPLRILLPLAIVVVSAVLLPFVLQPLFPALDAQIRRMLAMLIGLIVGLMLIAWDERGLPRFMIFRELGKGKSWSVLATVAGVLVFKAVLDSSGLLPVASRELMALGIPVACAVAALPLLAGVVTGLAIGFTGTSFPLVVGLMSADGSGLTPMATLVLAYVFGYMGMMFSPIHLCLVVSREYFSSPLLPVYRRFAPCMFTVLVAGILLHILYRSLGW